MISQENLIEKETIIFKDLSDILGPNVHEQSLYSKDSFSVFARKDILSLR